MKYTDEQLAAIQAFMEHVVNSASELNVARGTAQDVLSAAFESFTEEPHPADEAANEYLTAVGFGYLTTQERKSFVRIFRAGWEKAAVATTPAPVGWTEV